MKVVGQSRAVSAGEEVGVKAGVEPSVHSDVASTAIMEPNGTCAPSQTR